MLIQIRRDPLYAAAVVGEDQRRAMGLDFVGEQAIDRRPNRLLRQRAELRHRADHAQVEVLAQASIDDSHRPLLAVRVEAAEVAGDFVQRSLRRGQADAREPARAERFESLQQESEEDTAFVGTQGVDLIDDAVRHAAQGVARPRGQQQVQRFWCRDQHVRRTAEQALALGGGRVAGAHGHLDRRQRDAQRSGLSLHAFERHLQIAIDIVVERLQRRDVEDAHARREPLLAPQPVEAGKERRQRLA